MTFNPDLRVVFPDGSLGRSLPDFSNLSYLDSDTDVGVVTFDYPETGRFRSLLDSQTELAVLVDGKELPNSRFRIEESSGNTIDDNVAVTTWAGTTLLGRLDEVLVLPADDQHTREDVLTDKEKQALKEQRKEWMQQAIKDAIKAAKEKAKEHNAQVNPPDGGGTPGGGTNQGNLNQWGRKAIAWATNQVSSPSQDWEGWCQSFVRQSFGLPGVYETAAEAWFAGSKHPATLPANVPAGVPVYWAPNHVALSTGGGNCISTDFINVGDADFTTINAITSGWGLSYRGWSNDVSGRRIYP